MTKKNILKQTLLVMFAGLFLVMASGQAAASELLKFRKLTPPEVTRLSKESMREYELGLDAIDKINNEKALKHFVKAVELQPKHVQLRFVVVQLSHYLGDGAMGDESVKYYEIADKNLRAIVKSAKLNKRERSRADKSLDKIDRLRKSIVERDENRLKYGLELAKLYAKEIYDIEEKPEAPKPGLAQQVQSLMSGAKATAK